MSQVYFISDLHFGHKPIVQFSKRIHETPLRSGDDCVENMHNIINNWNSIITKRDIIYVLGDVAMTEEGFDAISELKGIKILIRGNHDDLFDTQKYLTVFKEVEGMIRYKGYFVTHCPIHPDELRGRINIHGHVHFNSIRNSYTGEYDKRYVNVCCEAVGETPYPFKKIVSGEYQLERLC